MNESSDPHPPVDPEQLAELDAALNALREPDRQAILLRYYAQENFAQLGQSLHISEEAARKRVHRALERLRGRLSRKAGAVTLVALLALLESNMAAPLPATALSGLKKLTESALAARSTGVASGLTWLPSWWHRVAVLGATFAIGLWLWKTCFSAPFDSSVTVSSLSTHPADGEANAKSLTAQVQVTFVQIPIAQATGLLAATIPANDAALLADLRARVHATQQGTCTDRNGTISCKLQVAVRRSSQASFSGIKLGDNTEYGSNPKITSSFIQISRILTGSAGAQAGLIPYDRLMEINGHPPIDANITQVEIDDTPPGQAITLQIKRNGSPKNMTVSVIPTDYAETQRKLELEGWINSTLDEPSFEGRLTLEPEMVEIEYATDYKYSATGEPNPANTTIRNFGDFIEMKLSVPKDKSQAIASFRLLHFLAPVQWRDWVENPANVYPEPTPKITQPEFIDASGDVTTVLPNHEIKLVQHSMVPKAHLPAGVTEDLAVYIFIQIHL